MDSFKPLDLILAHRWRRATLTTFSFSASFAEAVLVEALIRQGVTEIMILTDALGYRMALRERGAVRIGREYMVHPVTVKRGCFHPKIMVLEADDATHVTVGSGNVTFGGWSQNLECLEHLHTNGMAVAVSQVGDFFERLAATPGCDLPAAEECRALGSRLRQAAADGRDDGLVRVASTLDGALIDRVAEAAAELGPVERVTVASPYWDASAVDKLAARLGVESCKAHVPPARVVAPKDMDWPRASRIVEPVEVDGLAGKEASSRGLHAKMMEIICRDGRLVVSGSANATTAALISGGDSMRNVEMVVIRTDRRRGGRWKLRPAKAPPKPAATLDDEDQADDIGILVASHELDGIHGRIMTPWTSTDARVTLEVQRKPILLGTIPVDGKHFVIPLADLGAEFSLEGRIQLRLEGGEDVAEGFVSAPDFAAIRSKAGGALASMMAVLKNMQTPDDVLAVMEFFRTHPEALSTRSHIGGRSVATEKERPDNIVRAHLVGKHGGMSTVEEEAGQKAGRELLAWQNFVACLIQSFARSTTETEDEEDESDPTEVRRRRKAAEAMGKLEIRFPQLFEKLAGSVESSVELHNLLRLTYFVCVTTSHPHTEHFIQRLIRIGEGLPLDDVTRGELAWCLVYLAARGGALDAATARSRMQVIGIDPAVEIDPELALPGLADLLAPTVDIPAAVTAIRETRTVHDDVRSLEAGLDRGEVPHGLDTLSRHEAWPRLVRQFAREPGRRRINFVERPVTACPKCSMTLLHHLKSDLERLGMCEASCHGFILARNP